MEKYTKEINFQKELCESIESASNFYWGLLDKIFPIGKTYPSARQLAPSFSIEFVKQKDKPELVDYVDIRIVPGRFTGDKPGIEVERNLSCHGVNLAMVILKSDESNQLYDAIALWLAKYFAISYTMPYFKKFLSILKREERHYFGDVIVSTSNMLNNKYMDLEPFATGSDKHKACLQNCMDIESILNHLWRIGWVCNHFVSDMLPDAIRIKDYINNLNAIIKRVEGQVLPELKNQLERLMKELNETEAGVKPTTTPVIMASLSDDIKTPDAVLLGETLYYRKHVNPEAVKEALLVHPLNPTILKEKVKVPKQEFTELDDYEIQRREARRANIVGKVSGRFSATCSPFFNRDFGIRSEEFRRELKEAEREYRTNMIEEGEFRCGCGSCGTGWTPAQDNPNPTDSLKSLSDYADAQQLAQHVWMNRISGAHAVMHPIMLKPAQEPEKSWVYLKMLEKFNLTN